MFFGIKQAQSYISKVAFHSVGRLTADEESFIPESGRSKVYWIARAHILIYRAVYLRSILPLMYVGLPSLYCGLRPVISTRTGIAFAPFASWRSE
jgi:hypothetical protein